MKPKWETYTTWTERPWNSGFPDEPEHPEGDGWEPYASGLEAAPGVMVRWTAWRRVASDAGCGDAA